VKELHDCTNTRVWAGKAEVLRGQGWIAKIIAKVLGFPPASSETLVNVTLSPKNGGETWTRNFGGKKFLSFQAIGTGKNN
jgi:hypothetical protein